MNVWTHFAGFCWFLYLLWDLFWYHDYSQLTIPEVIAISIFMAAALVSKKRIDSPATAHAYRTLLHDWFTDTHLRLCALV